jgi:hypothetical protein
MEKGPLFDPIRQRRQSNASRISWIIASKLGMGRKLNGQSKS